MKMSELHEKPFIKALLSELTPSTNFINGFGHDSSIIDLGMGSTALAMKIDRAAKPIAALRGWCDYSLWGRIAVTSNCSDILASGGKVAGFMISISVPADWDSEVLRAITLGARDECNLHGVSFLGGDTKESAEPHVVGSAIGLVDKSKILNRSSANVGDIVVLAGQLGGFVGAYLQLDIDKCLSDRKLLIDYLAYPKAKWKEAEFIRSKVAVTSGTDLSDGLFDALKNVCSDGTGVLLELDSLPYHLYARQACDSFNIPLVNLSFSVGDWSIIYTVPSDQKSKIDEAQKLGLDLHVIGEITANPGVKGISRLSGKEAMVSGVVNQHFDSRLEDEKSFLQRIRTNVTLSPI